MHLTVLNSSGGVEDLFHGITTESSVPDSQLEAVLLYRQDGELCVLAFDMEDRRAKTEALRYVVHEPGVCKILGIYVRHHV